MDGRTNKLIRKVLDMPISRRFSYLLIIGILIPFSLLGIVSMGDILGREKKSMLKNAEQAYEQIFSSLEYRFYRLYRTAVMIGIDSEIREKLNQDPNSLEVSQQLNLYFAMLGYTGTVEANQDIQNIMFYVNDDYFFAEGSRRFGSISLVRNEEWYEEAVSSSRTLNWIVDRRRSGKVEEVSLTTLKPIYATYDLQQQIALLRLDISKEQIDALLDYSRVLDGQKVFLLSEYGRVIGGEYVEEETEDIWKLVPDVDTKQFQTVYLQGDKYYIQCRRINATDCYLISLFPADTLISGLASTIWFFGIFLVLIFLFVFFIYYRTTKNITSRIENLSEAFSEVEGGKPHLPVKQKDELGLVAQNFNLMVQKLDDLMEEQFVLGQKMSKMELMALQSQINPHFLYNTLDTIRWMSLAGKQTELQDLVESLCGYYKIVLSKGQDVIPIGEELELCQRYMQIQKYRFQDSIHMEIQVQEEIREYLIPKITLQPLVENAVLHGIREKKSRKGNVVIRGGEADESRLFLEVADDGIGMVHADGSRPSEGNGYGIGNIEQRLDLFNDGENSMSIFSIPGVGTTVRVALKKKKNNMPEDGEEG